MTTSRKTTYKEHHSTETALVRVNNDVLQQSVILILLDLSAAFDTVAHCILLSRLARKFVFKGNVLNWFSSYLTGRKHVKYGLSIHRDLLYGLPQALY
jgi:hypothetical protein